MPCRVDPIYLGTSRRKNNTALREVADKLTHELDEIREALLAGERPVFPNLKEYSDVYEEAKSKLVSQNCAPFEGVNVDEKLLKHTFDLLEEAESYLIAWATNSLTPGYMEDIRLRQIAHRQEDVKRLIHTFTDAGDYAKVGLLLTADITKPLKPQLGFDPDSY